jgi:hypothetical protein
MIKMANHLYMNAVGGVYVPRDIGLIDRYLYVPMHNRTGPIISLLMKPTSIRIILLTIAALAYVHVGYVKSSGFVVRNSKIIRSTTAIVFTLLFMLR